MEFDEHLKELARARDAVDRLHEIKVRLEKEEENRELKQDIALRAVLVAIIAGIVLYAYTRI